MRKISLLILVLLLAVCCASAAADTAYPLTPCSGSVSIDNTEFIVLTPETMDNYPDLVSSLAESKEALLEDWTARGVVLHAWHRNGKSRLEITVVQDDAAGRFFDLETQQSRQGRNEYKALQINEAKLDDNYGIFDVEWKNQKNGGNFLRYDYKRITEKATLRGCAGKTVRNGYTLVFDYQVYDRTVRDNDRKMLNKILNTVTFDAVSPGAADIAASSSSSETVSDLSENAGLLQIITPPPKETNDGVFTIEGRTTPKAHLVCVAMDWSGSIMQFTAESAATGSFKVKVTLPQESLWQMSLYLEVNGITVTEKIFEATTFNKSLLPVVLDAEVPEQLTSNELVLSGVTSKGVTVQCIVSNGTETFDKTVTTNGTGKFKFTVSTKLEADYDITLVLSKNKYNTRRLTYQSTRKLTVQDVQANTAGEAIHVSYKILTSKLDTYINRTMVYSAYIVDVQLLDEEYVIQAALKKNKDTYSDILYFMSGEDPHLEIGSKVKLYGRCVGAYQVLSEEENASYPGFDFIFSE